MTHATDRLPLYALWLGCRPYEDVYALQRELADRRKRDELPDILLLLEHEATVTSGRGARDGHLLSSMERLGARGVAFVTTDRGGDVTLHAPGQLVAYPIIKLDGERRDVRKYVNTLTGVMQHQVREWGIEAGTIPGLVGLWSDKQAPGRWLGHDAAVEPVKVGAIGVRISRWVTMHGFALNFTTDLNLFSHIVPCGIREYGVASVQSLTGRVANVAQEALRIAPVMAEHLGLSLAATLSWDGSLDVEHIEQMVRPRAP